MPVPDRGAQRASSPHRRPAWLAIAATFLLLFGAAIAPTSAAAAGVKVVIVVGPVGSQTGAYKDSARRYASLARSYGASVVEVYSPYATWTKVKAAAKGANLFIYLGHGNGYPSPHGSFQKFTKDGLGLNASSGNGNSNNKYWGEYYVARELDFAKNAVVILNRLCYAAGNSEWGSANPSRSTAVKRVDNYGAGFLRADARAVFAEATSSVSYQIKALLTTNKSVDAILMGHPSASGARDFKFDSSRTPGYRAHLDPPKSGKYWRSVIGNLSLTAPMMRAGD